MAAARLNKGPQSHGSKQAGALEAPATDATGNLPALPVRATILIVDDEANNRFALSQVLAELEETVVEAASGEDALRFLLREECALILLDANMPGIDGYTTAELIRRRERSRHIPIIFVSAIDRDDEHIARAYAMGAVDYVFKPVDPVILRSKVAVLVDLYRKSAEVERKVALEHFLQEENLRIRQEKLEAERQLRQIEERQNSIVRSLPIALYSAGIDQSFAGPRFISDVIAELIGFAPEQFLDDPHLWVNRIHPEDRDQVLAEVAAIPTLGGMSTEYRWLCADGSHRWFLDRAVLIRHEGRPFEIFGSSLDVTDRRRVEQQLVQSQKMEAVGQLTGGIAHDFNNMLTVVIGNLDSLARQLKGTGRNFDRAQMALTGALSCAELTRRMLAFARRQPLQPSPVNLGEVSRNITKLLGRTLGERIQIDVRVPDELWNVLADPAQVESSLINLAVNARDAMTEGGTLTIEARNIGRHAREADVPEDEFVLLSVTDTGAGMTPEVLERALEPFFTTKRMGHGTGLGLSMVYGFVKQSGGHVKIISTPGRGTSVRIYLPRTEAMPTISVGTGEDLSLSGRDRTILLVEDDAGVRAVTAAMLKELQFNVIEADNGARALDIVDRESDIDLLFTDIVMPGGMNGFELGRLARERRPQLPVLYATGYSASYAAPEKGADMLAKPYREADLRSKLRGLLPARASLN
ncbi:response regulator [Steroidobacter sp.]|uniref:response regulator n=1 Tax=Steroidobacter sp. TaxID=1978227 RepID=UPI001A5F1886|nr:response regulator [Steroidobacter sp.]MBL8271182.1 response regulator [Steroidobacter sp.]